LAVEQPLSVIRFLSVDMQLICLNGAIIKLICARPTVIWDFVSRGHGDICISLSWHSDIASASMNGKYFLIAICMAALDGAYSNRSGRLHGKKRSNCKKNS